MNNKVIETEFGYFSIKDLPTQDELESYYAEKYYQNNLTQYSHQYSKDELQYFTKAAIVAKFLYESVYINDKKALLDVGAGEGFFAAHFFNSNWNVTTLDYSSYGLLSHNTELVDTLIQGDIFKSINELTLKKVKYDLINLSNVLEHVIDPIDLLYKLKTLLSDKSLLRISVPNDYSKFQQYLLDKKYTSNTWLCPPDHLHYFTFESLSKLLESLGYEVVFQLGEFPIELYLSNSSSNYDKNKELGKFAHKSRVEVDNFLFDQGIEKYINYYQASAEIGFSRQVVMYAKVKE